MNYFYNNAFDFNIIYIDEHGRFVPYGARVDVESDIEFGHFENATTHMAKLLFINGLSNGAMDLAVRDVRTPITELKCASGIGNWASDRMNVGSNFLGSIHEFFQNYIKDNWFGGYPGNHTIKLNTMPIYTGKANPPPVFHYMTYDFPLKAIPRAYTCFIDWELGDLHRSDCMSCQSMLKYLRDAAVMLDKQFFCFKRDITSQDDNFVVIKNNLKLHKNSYKVIALNDPEEKDAQVELKHIMQYFTNSFEGILTLGHIHTLRLSDGFSKGIQTVLNY